jgi:hypothetical protein
MEGVLLLAALPRIIEFMVGRWGKLNHRMTRTTSTTKRRRRRRIWRRRRSKKRTVLGK